MDAILSTSASISGNFNQEDAKSLATSLKYGALPVAFEDNPKNDTIGPSLAGNQLSAGIWAGIVGLLLVMLYCLLYYRGLGMVVIASLIVAGVDDLRHGAAAQQERASRSRCPASRA
jgi:preprotein translocase subunit SecD